MSATNPVFRPGDTVCWLGDSITHCGSIHSLIYLYWLTRFPGTDLTFWNCGRAGGVTHQATARYDREIAPLRPTVAALMFGMNDCGRHRYGVTHETTEDLASRTAHFEEFKLRTRLLVERLQAEGCRIILQTPTPYDQTALDRPGWPADGRVTPGREHANDALGRFAEWLRQTAPVWGATVVDYHRPFTELTLQLQAADPAFSMTGDRVHPESCWFLMAACEFLTQTGMPATVAEARIDAVALRSESVPALPVLTLQMLPGPWSGAGNEGILLRLLNASDAPQSARIGSGLLRVSQAARCDLFGNSLEDLPVNDEAAVVELPARGLAVLRLSLERRP